MSAEIDMSNDRINFAKREDVSVWWERPDTKMNIIEPGDSIGIIAAKAGIDFPITTTQTFYSTDNGEGVVAKPSKAFSIIRQDTGAELGYGVTKGYKPHQPLEIANTMDRICKLAGMEIITAGSLRGGGTIWIQATRGDMEYRVGTDLVKRHLVLSGDNTGKVATRGHNTQVVVVCANTFRCMESDSRSDTVTLSHRGEYDEEILLEKLGYLDSLSQSTEEVVQTMREREMTGTELVEFIMKASFMDRNVSRPKASTISHAENVIFGGDFKKVDHIPDEDEAKEAKSVGKVAHQLWDAYQNSPGQRERGRNRWAAFNAVTFYADHVKTAKGGAEGRLIASQEGSAAKLKRSVMELLAA